MTGTVTQAEKRANSACAHDQARSARGKLFCSSTVALGHSMAAVLDSYAEWAEWDIAAAVAL